MHFYAIYTANLEQVFVHDECFTTDEFHAMCEEAPRILIGGEWVHSETYIREWLTEFYGFRPVPYTATFHAF